LRASFDKDLKIYLAAAGFDDSLFPGRDLFSTALNTAIELGSPPVRLCAFLHGQCEIHGWIAEEDRSTFADIIADGRRLGIFRSEMGWEGVIDLLRDVETHPGEVVTSYSVTESFPDHSQAIEPSLPPKGDYSKGYDNMTEGERGEAEEREEARWEVWNGLTANEQWAAGMAWLRAGPDMQMKPELDRRFGDGSNGFTFFERPAAQASVHDGLNAAVD